MGPERQRKGSQGKQRKVLDVKAFTKLLDNCETLRDSLLLRILFETGCSVAELASIKSCDVSFPDDSNSLPSISFNDPKRSSAISSSLADSLRSFLLKQQRKSQEYLFSQQPEKPFSVKRVEQIISALSDDTITPQDIRYLHVIHAASRGLTPDAIAQQTGLSRQRILQILDIAEITYRQSYSMFFENLGGKP